MVDRDDDVKLGLKTSAILFGKHDVVAVMACHCAFHRDPRGHRRLAGLWRVVLRGPACRGGTRGDALCDDPRPHARGMLQGVPAQQLDRASRSSWASSPTTIRGSPSSAGSRLHGSRDPRPSVPAALARVRGAVGSDSRPSRRSRCARSTTSIRISTSTCAAEQAALERAGLIVWLHPLYWYTVPATDEALVRRGAPRRLGPWRGRHRAEGQALPVGRDDRGRGEIRHDRRPCASVRGLRARGRADRALLPHEVARALRGARFARARRREARARPQRHLRKRGSKATIRA